MASPLRLCSVAFAFPGQPPLFEGLDLEIQPGTTTALVGRSGCGKSTVLRLVAGLLRPSAGRIDAPTGRMGFVFQSPTLLAWRTLADNVRLPLELGDRREGTGERVREELRRAGLEGLESRLPRDLSGGQRMRASLARALVTAPELLLLDEPFSALDPLTRRALQQAFMALQQRDRFTALMVTHDLDEAVWLADRVVVLAGRPARLAADLAVDLPRPRSLDLLHDPALGRLAAAVEAAL